jgi:hypothetical protein
VLPGPPVSAPRRAAPLARTFARTPAAATGPRRRPAPLVSHVVPRRARRCPPLSVARARHAREACTTHRCQSSPKPLHPCRAGPHRRPTLGPSKPPPPFFPSPPCAPSAFKSRQPPTSLPFSSIFFSVHSVCRFLKAPPPSLSVPSPVASPPHHRETEP